MCVASLNVEQTDDANALADLLLMWLEELPEPLVKDFAFFSEAMRTRPSYLGIGFVDKVFFFAARH